MLGRSDTLAGVVTDDDALAGEVADLAILGGVVTDDDSISGTMEEDMAVEQPKTLYLTESRVFRLTVVQSSDGERKDLTGVGLEFQIKAADGDADPPLVSKSVGSGITLLPQTGTTLGQADIEVLSTDTGPANASWPTAPPDGVFRYDVVLIDTDTRRYYIVPPSDFHVRAVVNEA